MSERHFFCAIPYDRMLLVSKNCIGERGAQSGQPVRITLRYLFDVRDLPPAAAEIFGLSCTMRTYVRDFQLCGDGIRGHRADEQEDGTYLRLEEFFPMPYARAANLMKDIAEKIGRESSSGDLWQLAESLLSRART